MQNNAKIKGCKWAGVIDRAVESVRGRTDGRRTEK